MTVATAPAPTRFARSHPGRAVKRGIARRYAAERRFRALRHRGDLCSASCSSAILFTNHLQGLHGVRADHVQARRHARPRSHRSRRHARAERAASRPTTRCWPRARSRSALGVDPANKPQMKEVGGASVHATSTSQSARWCSPIRSLIGKTRADLACSRAAVSTRCSRASSIATLPAETRKLSDQQVDWIDKADRRPASSPSASTPASSPTATRATRRPPASAARSSARSS